MKLIKKLKSEILIYGLPQALIDKYINICLVGLGYLDFSKRTTAPPSIAIAVPISLTLKPGKSQSSLGGGVLRF